MSLAFSIWVLLRVGVVFLAAFFGGGFTLKPADTVRSALAVIGAPNSPLGMKLAPDKCSEPCDTLALLGAHLPLGRTFAEATPRKRKSKDFRHGLRATIQRGVLSPAAAAKLRGILGRAHSTPSGDFAAPP